VGQVLATFPAYFPIDVAVAVATAAVPQWKRRAFAATSVSSVVWIVGAHLWWRRQLPNLWGGSPTWSLPAGAFVSSVVIRRRFLEAGTRR
jgi:glycerol-3-phosphate acyltransferase PlsY